MFPAIGPPPADGTMIKEFPIINEEPHLTIYAVDPSPEVDEERGIINQFERTSLAILPAGWLGVPTVKHGFKVVD